MHEKASRNNTATSVYTYRYIKTVTVSCANMCLITNMITLNIHPRRVTRSNFYLRRLRREEIDPNLGYIIFNSEKSIEILRSNDREDNLLSLQDFLGNFQRVNETMRDDVCTCSVRDYATQVLASRPQSVDVATRSFSARLSSPLLRQESESPSSLVRLSRNCACRKCRTSYRIIVSIIESDS